MLKIRTIQVVVFLVFFLGCVGDLYSQDNGITEKDTINGMVLCKAFAKNTKDGWGLISGDPKTMDGSVAYYFDDEGNLRKLVSWSNYPESSSATIAYYSEEGELMHIIFSDSQPEGYSYSGIAYKMHREENNNNIDFKYKVRYSFMADFENSYVQGNSNKYPSSIGKEQLPIHANIDSLKSHLRIEKFQPPSNCTKVRFYKPSKNQITFINNENVNLREGANTSSKVIVTMGVGDRVKVLEVMREESVKNLGSHNWYKVAINDLVGYIFGAYLEPVDGIIKP